MKKLITITLAVAAFASCSSTKPQPLKQDVSTSTVIIRQSDIDHKLQRPDKNSPREVIAFARGLASFGRHAESAKVYRDASDRFTSIGKDFENDCRREAVRQYWLAGDNSTARTLLAQLQANQDIYSHSSESVSFRNLKKLIIAQ
ncbi:MAG: hypothetical protein HRT88_10490 [Lentisphaeraceae bacterium]|nr:hypothetical protein [Lentisphaeraceae bacterium]